MSTGKMTGSQSDKLDKFKHEGKLSTNVLAQDGLLNPEAWDSYDPNVRKYGAETERIAAGIEELLNENFSKGGKYAWKAAFFLEDDPRVAGGDGYRPLLAKQLGPLWSEELRRTMGLHEYEGAVCWGGRGTFERHIICVIVTEKRAVMRQLVEKRTEEMLRPPKSVAGEKAQVTVKETAHKVPRNAETARAADEGLEDPDETET